MTNTRLSALSLRLSGAATALVMAATAQAAGPLALCGSGQPFLWGNGGRDIVYNLDQGNLGPVNAEDAALLVRQSFDAWEDIPTSSLSYVEGDMLPVDVDVTNFAEYLFAPAPDGLSAIVYDDTGDIFEVLFGAESGILGFAGPEWADPSTCTIFEGLSFLNGPAIEIVTEAVDIAVHEFGHLSNFAHTVVNGQLFIGLDDTSGPAPVDTFPVPFPPIGDQAFIETMYPFYFGPVVGTQSPQADDIASASTLYPDGGFDNESGTIAGTIYLGDIRKTGVNVIARNITDPFFDAVSAISSDYTDTTSQSDPLVGTYRITGLTPGAQYVVYVDELLDGGFSTSPASPLPGPEEFYNGAGESGDPASDDPQDFVTLMAAAGAPLESIDILFNIAPPGLPLPTGDDGSIEIPLPFEYCVAGRAYSSVYINANGFLTVGEGDQSGATFFPDENAFLAGPARIAALWADLSPNVAGSVRYFPTPASFTVIWQDVPEFGVGGSNTFVIRLARNSRDCTDAPGRNGLGPDVLVLYGDMTARNGLSGVSAGIFATSQFETESNLSKISFYGLKRIDLRNEAAVFESFTQGDMDLRHRVLQFDGGGRTYVDRFEHNDSLDRARKVTLAFDSIDTRRRFTSISPFAADIDFFRFNATAGNFLLADIVTGQIDSVMGLWYCGPATPSGYPAECDPDTAFFFGFIDDKGFGPNPLLSAFIVEVPVDGTYAIGVTFCCDYDFDGVDPGQGEPFDEGRYVIDVFEIPPGAL